MKIKKLTAILLSAAMVAGNSVMAMAASPSAYDGKSYESVGYKSEDPDGQINLAVIANGDVKIVGDSMYIQGSVYSNGNIYVGDGAGNKIDGLFISGTEGSVDVDEANGLSHICDGYIHVNDNGTRDGITYYSTKPEYAGAIKDTDTSFECSYADFTVPTIDNDLGDTEMTVYYNDDWKWSEELGSYSVPGPNAPKTITEDTHIGKLTMNGTQDNWRKLDAAMIIDTTEGDVTVVIDNLDNPTNPSIKVVGDHQAYIYIKNVGTLSNLALNYNTNNYDSNWQLSPVANGSSANTHLYLEGDSVELSGNYIGAADINVNASSLTIDGSSKVYADINSGAESFTITGGSTEVYGTVCVPNAESKVVDSGTLYGQLHTDTLTINGAGRIIWQADSGVEAIPTEASTEESTETTTEAVTETTTETTTIEVDSGDPIDGKCNFAYIFGYEPTIETDEKTGEEKVVYLPMAGSDNVTREQVCAMVMRIVDQNTNSKGKSYTNTSNFEEFSEWATRGVAYICEQGTYSDEVNNLHGTFPLTRGEVAQIVASGLHLQLKDGAAEFSDTADSKYKPYIDIMTSNGFMRGDGNGEFRPNAKMTRGEFCAMFNVVTGRDGYSLITADGTIVTAETYSFTDADDLNNAWYGPICLLATSAFDNNGYVDLEVRNANVRNNLDQYDAQKKY